MLDVALEEAPQWTDAGYGDGMGMGMSWMVRVEGVEAGELGRGVGDGVTGGVGSSGGGMGLGIGNGSTSAGGTTVAQVEDLVEKYRER